MLKVSIRTAFLSALLGCPAITLAQDTPADDSTLTEVAIVPVVVDLARAAEQSITLAAGTYGITLINAVPGRDYWLHIGPSFAAEAPTLPADAIGFRKLEAVIGRSGVDPKCSAIDAATTLVKATGELEVRAAAEQVRVAIATDPPECTDAIAVAREVLSATQVRFATPVVMAENVVRQLRISSRSGGEWDVELSTTGRGMWQTTYGFSFSPNRDQEYFTEETGESQFTVRRKSRESGALTFLPTVFFTWLSTSQAFTNLQHGPTVGVGVTTGSVGGRFSALGGWSLRFNQNIGVVVGVSVYPHRRLDGQYEEGQVLKENLTDDQLNKDSVRANVFASLTLRLGSSPFAGSAKDRKQ